MNGSRSLYKSRKCALRAPQNQFETVEDVEELEPHLTDSPSKSVSPTPEEDDPQTEAKGRNGEQFGSA
jgi:hypothetical protein